MTSASVGFPSGAAHAEQDNPCEVAVSQFVHKCVLDCVQCPLARHKVPDGWCEVLGVLTVSCVDSAFAVSVQIEGGIADILEHIRISYSVAASHTEFEGPAPPPKSKRQKFHKGGPL